MRFGPWQVEEEIGRGGMGVVYACRHVDTGAEAAVKTLRATTDGALEALWREVYALSRVEHPQIVRIRDHGTTEEQPWVALERVPGRSLADLVHGARAIPEETFDLSALSEDDVEPTGAPTRGGLELAHALSLVAALCHPLATLHGAGLVHRDLKCDNVVVRPDGVPVLLDLGLAAATSGRAPLRGVETTTGTPDTVAPEQVAGELVDARADLYALGCVAFQLLAGRPPFMGTPLQIVHGHRDRPPPSLRELRPEVPASVDALIGALLAKDPRKRPGHALEVRSVLEAAGAAVPSVDDLPTPSPYVYRPRLVGRHEVMAPLVERVQRMPRENGAVRVLPAPSGGGKTRLLRELSGVARASQLPLLSIDCTPEDRAAGDRHTAARLARQLAWTARRFRQADVWGPWGPVLCQLAPGLAAEPGVRAEPEPISLDPVAHRTRLAMALGDVVVGVARDRGCVLLVDDLQWAGPLIRELVTRLASRVPGQPLLMVAAWRSEEEDAALAALRSEHPELTAAPLDRASVVTLLSDMLAGPPPESLVRAVLSRSGGSPLWVTELVAASVQSGRLHRTPRGWNFHSEGLATDSLDAVISERARELPEPARLVLERAAVQGRVVHPSWLGVDPAVRAEGLRVLLARRLVVPHEERLAFAHDRIREATLRSLSSEGLREHHLALAAALQDSPHRVAHLADLARHLQEGGEVARAVRVWGEAAEHEQTHLGDPAPMHRAALALATTPTEETVERRAALVRALLLSDAAAAAEEIEALREAAAALGTPRAMAFLREAEGQVAGAKGETETSVEALREALALHREAGPVPMEVEVRLLNLLARAHRRVRDHAEAMAVLETLLERDPDNFDAWCTLASVRRLEGSHEAAAVALERAGALASTPIEQARVLDARLIVTMGRTDLDETRELLARLGARAEELDASGVLDAASIYWQHIAVFQLELAEYEVAEVAARRSLAGAQRLGVPMRACYAWYFLGMLHRLGAGDLDAAEHAAHQVARLGALCASPRDEADGHLELGHVALARGEDARPWLARATEAVGTSSADDHQRHAFQRLADAIAARDRGERLFRGTRREDLTEPQRARAVREGLLAPEDGDG